MRTLSIFILSITLATTVQAEPARYFYAGDGKLAVKGGKKILQHLSPRLIALLDYLQEKLSHGKSQVEIWSGYRSPEYNESLRQKGKLAGKASMHIEGMAADFTMVGVASRKIWEYVRSLNCCGVGYYHGEAVHLDTGPARFWDEKTTKVFTDISLHNKQIYVVTEYDIYQPGEKLNFNLVRLTELPFGMKNEMVLLKDNKEWKKMTLAKQEGCFLIRSRQEAKDLSIELPEAVTPQNQKLKLKVFFCSKPSEEMPDFISSNPFIIASPE